MEVNLLHELLMYDQIGGYGITTKSTRATLNYLKANESSIDKLLIRIISEGGSVFEAKGIISAFKDFKQSTGAKIEVVYDLYGASAATLIAQEIADTVYIQPDAQILIHHLGANLYINKDNIDESSEFIKNESKPFIEMYAKRMGVSYEKADALMSENRWLKADEAIELGLVDAIYEGDQPNLEKITLYASKVKESKGQDELLVAQSIELLDKKVIELKAESVLTKYR